MQKFESLLASIPDEELQPAQPADQTNIHEIPLYVVAFKESFSKDPSIITRPGRQLMVGKRVVARSIESDANDIARRHQVISSAHARLTLPVEEKPYSQGYSVRRANHTPLPNIADFTHTEYEEDHGLPLELHNYSQLLEQLNEQPQRQTEAAYLRAFGALVLKKPS